MAEKNSLWKNIKANRGSGKQPTTEMLRQERKIRAQKAEGDPIGDDELPTYRYANKEGVIGGPRQTNTGTALPVGPDGLPIVNMREFEVVGYEGIDEDTDKLLKHWANYNSLYDESFDDPLIEDRYKRIKSLYKASGNPKLDVMFPAPKYMAGRTYDFLYSGDQDNPKRDSIINAYTQKYENDKSYKDRSYDLKNNLFDKATIMAKSLVGPPNMYSPLSNEVNYMSTSNFNDNPESDNLISELSHAYQQNKLGKNVAKEWVKEMIDNPTFTSKSYHQKYKNPNSFENEAHSVIQPRIQEYLDGKISLEELHATFDKKAEGGPVGEDEDNRPVKHVKSADDPAYKNYVIQKRLAEFSNLPHSHQSYLMQQDNFKNALNDNNLVNLSDSAWNNFLNPTLDSNSYMFGEPAFTDPTTGDYGSEIFYQDARSRPTSSNTPGYDYVDYPYANPNDRSARWTDPSNPNLSYNVPAFLQNHPPSRYHNKTNYSGLTGADFTYRQQGPNIRYIKPKTPQLENITNLAELQKIYPGLTQQELDAEVLDRQTNPFYLTNRLNANNQNILDYSSDYPTNRQNDIDYLARRGSYYPDTISNSYSTNMYTIPEWDEPSEHVVVDPEIEELKRRGITNIPIQEDPVKMQEVKMPQSRMPERKTVMFNQINDPAWGVKPENNPNFNYSAGKEYNLGDKTGWHPYPQGEYTNKYNANDKVIEEKYPSYLDYLKQNSDEYNIQGEYANGGYMYPGGGYTGPGGPGDIKPTRQDSLMLFNNALEKIKFYKGNPDYQQIALDKNLRRPNDFLKHTNFKDPIQRKNLIREGQRKAINGEKITRDNIQRFTKNALDKNKPLTAKETIKINQQLNKAKYSKVPNTNLTSFGDILYSGTDDINNPLAPSIYLHPEIAPQGSEFYVSERWGDSTDIPYYDPIAVAPFDKLTPEQKEKRVEKYGDVGVPQSYMNSIKNKNKTNTSTNTNTSNKSNTPIVNRTPVELQNLESLKLTNLPIQETSLELSSKTPTKRKAAINRGANSSRDADGNPLVSEVNFGDNTGWHKVPYNTLDQYEEIKATGGYLNPYQQYAQGGPYKEKEDVFTSPLNEGQTMFQPETKWYQDWINDPEYAARMEKNFKAAGAGNFMEGMGLSDVAKNYNANENRKGIQALIKTTTGNLGNIKTLYNRNPSINESLISEYKTKYGKDPESLKIINKNLGAGNQGWTDSEGRIVITPNANEMYGPSSVKVHEDTHATGLDTMFKGKFKPTSSQDPEVQKNFRRVEQYPFLMQMRYDQGFKPGEEITPERLKQIRESGYQNHLFKNYTDDELSNYLNTLASNTGQQSNEQYASKGGYYASGGKYLTADGIAHKVYRGANGDIMVNHPKNDYGKWDTLNLTDKSNANTIAQGVASVRKWHRENPSYAQGGYTNPYNQYQDDPYLQYANGGYEYGKGGRTLKNIGAGAFGVLEGVVDATFGWIPGVDYATDMAYKGLQKVGGSSADEIREQDSIHGYGQTAGAVGSAILTGGATTGMAISEGAQGLGQGISKGNETSEVARGIGTGLNIAGTVVGTAYNVSDAGKSATEGFKLSKAGSEGIGKFAAAAPKSAAAIKAANDTATAARLASTVDSAGNVIGSTETTIKGVDAAGNALSMKPGVLAPPPMPAAPSSVSSLAPNLPTAATTASASLPTSIPNSSDYSKLSKIGDVASSLSALPKSQEPPPMAPPIAPTPLPKEQPQTNYNEFSVNPPTINTGFEAPDYDFSYNPTQLVFSQGGNITNNSLNLHNTMRYKRFAQGGTFDQYGINMIPESAGLHHESAYGGVPIGPDALAEGGEIKMDIGNGSQYIVSDQVDGAETQKDFTFSKGGKYKELNRTLADGMKQDLNKYTFGSLATSDRVKGDLRRPNDSYGQSTVEQIKEKWQQKTEYARQRTQQDQAIAQAEEQKKMAEEQYIAAYGGRINPKKYPGLNMTKKANGGYVYNAMTQPMLAEGGPIYGDPASEYTYARGGQIDYTNDMYAGGGPMVSNVNQPFNGPSAQNRGGMYIYPDGGMMAPQDEQMMQEQQMQQQAPQEEMQQQPNQEQMMQMVQQVEQMLQQGTPPEQIMQQLVQSGVPPEQAQQVVQMAMQEAQGQMQQQEQQPMQGQQQMMPQQGMMARGGYFNGKKQYYAGSVVDPTQDGSHSMFTTSEDGSQMPNDNYNEFNIPSNFVDPSQPYKASYWDDDTDYNRPAINSKNADGTSAARTPNGLGMNFKSAPQMTNQVTALAKLAANNNASNMGQSTDTPWSEEPGYSKFARYGQAIPGVLAAITGMKNKKRRLTPDKMTAQTVNYEPERIIDREESRRALDSGLRTMRGSAPNAGMLMGNTREAILNSSKGLAGRISESIMREKNTNAQLAQQASGANFEAGNQFKQLNEQMFQNAQTQALAGLQDTTGKLASTAGEERKQYLQEWIARNRLKTRNYNIADSGQDLYSNNTDGYLYDSNGNRVSQ
jgi:hypothetical protein